MANRKRFEDERYEDYKKALYYDAKFEKKLLKGNFVWLSSAIVGDDINGMKVVRQQGTYVKGAE